MDFQSTLFEPPPSTALGFDDLRRRELTEGAWIDVARTWLPEADDVLAALVRDVPWRSERRQMYDRVVDVPRLVHTYMIDEPLPHPVLVAAREALSDHYLPELHERSAPPGAATTATDATASPGTATPSAGAPPTTRWSRSSRSVTPAGSSCGRGAAVSRSRSSSGTATWS